MLSSLFNPASISLMLIVFFINCLISSLIALILVSTVRIEIMKSKAGFFLLLMCLGTFVPILGSLLAIASVFLLHAYGKDFAALTINTHPTIEYSRKNPIKTAAYGTSWANVRFESSHFSKDEQIKALRSVSRRVARDVNIIYSKLVSDEMEELRVCAFSLLENQQTFLHNKIHQLLKKFHPETPTKKQAFIAKQLSLLYWELVYRNLSDKEFRSIVLERSHYYASYALEIMQDDSTLWILCSRIDIELGKIENSVENLAKAASLKAPPGKYIPYLAEIAYKNKDFISVRESLESDPSIAYLFKIRNIFKFWCRT